MSTVKSCGLYVLKCSANHIYIYIHMYITNIQKQLYSSCTQRANVLKPDKKKGRAVVSGIRVYYKYVSEDLSVLGFEVYKGVSETVVCGLGC